MPDTSAPTGDGQPSTPPVAPPSSEATTPPFAPPEEYVVEIPRRRGLDAIALVVEDQETADALRALRNNGLRLTAYHDAMASVEHRRIKLELLEQAINIDPIGFLADQLDRRLVVDTARHLLSLPEVFAALSPELMAWQDAAVRERRRGELAAVREASRRAAEVALKQIATARGRVTERVEPDAVIPEQPLRPVRTVVARRVRVTPTTR